MKLIAHRGLFLGPDEAVENSPEQIDKALSNEFDAEIDLWYTNGELWLGHDNPTYPISKNWLDDRVFKLWIHAKNLGALRWLSDTSYNFFWHQKDDFVITSHGYIWTYPGKSLTTISINVMPEWLDPDLKDVNRSCYGICSDFIEKIA